MTDEELVQSIVHTRDVLAATAAEEAKRRAAVANDAGHESAEALRGLAAYVERLPPNDADLISIAAIEHDRGTDIGESEGVRRAISRFAREPHGRHQPFTAFMSDLATSVSHEEP